MPSQSFPVVAIGASAGGIEALRAFFRSLPDRPGMAFVVVTHLSPQRESRLAEIVATFTGLPVEAAADGVALRPDVVYIRPPDVILGISGRRLTVEIARHGRVPRPIDLFFGDLAIDLGERAVGVVLSGADSDGTLGVKAIKERGGLTIAQAHDGHPPAQPAMPQSAIASGFIDLTVSVEEMGSILSEFVEVLSRLDVADADADADTGDASAGGERPDRIKAEICTVLRNQVGHDFAGYKSKTFMRRVQRRMQMTQRATVPDYLDFLREEPQEVSALFRDLLINVTNFFRDAEAFEVLAADIVPGMLRDRPPGEPVRIWVPGCSTGEEVYSIGILLRERMAGIPSPPRVQIFATDIDERALGVARTARYPAALLENVSQARRERFFLHDAGSYVVTKDVRDMCLFSPHSVISDPPFSRIDLVSCRNLLIYFGTDIQGQVIPAFHYALRPDGHLFLGSAENVSQFEDLFVTVDHRHRIFRRRAGVPALRLPLPLPSLRTGIASDAAGRAHPLTGVALRHLADSNVLERHAPAHVIVNRDGDVLYFSPRTGKYLESPHGQPTRQLLTMARKMIRLDLRNLFEVALSTGVAATRDDVAVDDDAGRVQMIRLTVEPVRDREDDRAPPLYLVLFEDLGGPVEREAATARSVGVLDGNVASLERELAEARERLQTIVEEYETALEELKSSNEELVLLNEEMQSANEELEASKEELQSLNEELQALNAELSLKLDELDRANGDLRNLFESTQVATMFLDRDLAIQSFTPSVRDILNVLPGDRGRPLTDLTGRVRLADLVGDLRRVLIGHGVIERRAETTDASASYLVRIGPYQDSERRVDGVVLSFVDVTDFTRSEARQLVLIAELQHRTRNLLTIVQSIARRTLGGGEAVERFSERLVALGRAQGLGNDEAGRPADLAAVIRREVGLVAGARGDRVSIDGPPVTLATESGQMFGLAVHELATNALRHGALRDRDGAPAGRLAVEWRIVPPDAADDPARVVLDWVESGVDLQGATPGPGGYGRSLLERSLAFTLKAVSGMSVRPDGIAWRIDFPLARPGDGGEDRGTAWN